MTRALIPCVLLVTGVVSFAAPASQKPEDASKPVQMRTLSVYDILYVISGSGGNSAALMADDGVVLVDTKRPGFGKVLSDTILAVHDAPVTTIINTHAHVDHTGSNSEFPKIIDIIAHEKAKATMMTMDAFKGPNAKFLPTKTFTETMSLQVGPDLIDLYYFGAGHTDGDAVVVFRKQRVAFMGDLFPGKGVPVIDTRAGGSGLALPRTLAKAVAAIKDVDRVVSGHETSSASGLTYRPMRWSDFLEYAEFTQEFLAAVQQAQKAGKRPEEAVASLGLPDKYKGYDLQGTQAAVQAIYEELQK